jgi:hypothetical protein
MPGKTATAQRFGEGMAAEPPEHRQPDHASGSAHSFGSRSEAPAQRLLPREHGIFGSCAAGMARPPCSLWTAGAGCAPSPLDPSGLAGWGR